MTEQNLPAYFRNHPKTMHRWRKFWRDWMLYPIGLRFLVKLERHHTHYIPTMGPTIIISNHIAAIDPVMSGNAIKKRYVTPLGKKEIKGYPVLGPMAKSWGFVPVDREGADRRALLKAIAILNEGEAIFIAPEGTRNPSLVTFKIGLAYIATKTNATIVPSSVIGTEEFVRNLWRLKRTPVTVTYGPPFKLNTKGQKRVSRDVLEQMSTEIGYQVAKLLPPERHGVYAHPNGITTDRLTFVDVENDEHHEP